MPSAGHVATKDPQSPAGHRPTTAIPSTPPCRRHPAPVTPGDPSDPRAADQAVCAPIRRYRVLSAARSPTAGTGRRCSTYALEALEAHGAGRGLWLAARRLPAATRGVAPGVDLVPRPAPAARLSCP